MNLELIKCDNGKWKIGPTGECRWETKKMAHAARTHFKVHARREGRDLSDAKE